MAVADNVLFGIESLDELQQLEIPPGEDELMLNFKESALNRPILSRCTKQKGTAEGIMPKNAFLRIFPSHHEKGGLYLRNLDSRN